LAAIEEKEQIQREEKSGIATQIDTLEAALQQNKLDSLTKEKNLAAQQKASNEYTAKIRAYESEKRVKNEQLKNSRIKKPV
jgi:chromosome segregation protein